MMKYLFRTTALTLFCMVSVSHATLAQEDTKKLAEENKQKVEKEIQKETPITQWIKAENEVIEALPEEGRQVFFILRNKHNVMRSIEMVERDVGNAVKECGENNKDMSEAMDMRFKQWKDSINPILSDAKEFLDLELKEQKAFDVADFKRISTMNDEAFKFSESKVEKQIVTTQEACQSLLESMDRTEENLIDILQDALLPEEVVRMRLEQIKKAEQAKDKGSEK